MYDAASDASKNRGVWLANGETSGKLSELANYDSSRGMETLFGKPILYSEYCSALGDAGDLILADLSEYAIFRKPLDAAQSVHVYFSTVEQAFRFMIRIDGSPLWNSAIPRLTVRGLEAPLSQ
jgi:HK97 family phage major capsid protein